MKTIFLLSWLLACSLSTTAQQADTFDMESEKAAVTDLIERFLVHIGNYELDSLPGLFSENANIGGSSLRNGQGTSYTMTFAQFLERLRSDPNPSKYQEPVQKFTVHMDGGMLAFVKADAVLIKDGIPRSNNYDYFTLLKENGRWKILNGSYVSIPIKQE